MHSCRTISYWLGASGVLPEWGVGGKGQRMERKEKRQRASRAGRSERDSLIRNAYNTIRSCRAARCASCLLYSKISEIMGAAASVSESFKSGQTDDASIKIFRALKEEYEVRIRSLLALPFGPDSTNQHSATPPLF